MHDDLKELIASLIASKVEFIIVGSTVLAFYGRPRYTEDIDLWVRPTQANVSRLVSALAPLAYPWLLRHSPHSSWSRTR
jgi:predicted nucleotidyltransferase